MTARRLDGLAGASSALLLLFGSACSSAAEEFAPDPAFLDAAGCVAEMLNPTNQTYSQIIGEVQISSSANAFTINFSIGGTTYTVDGTKTLLAGDLSDGFGPGDSVLADWTLTSSAGAFGSGSFQFDYDSATSLRTTGGGFLEQGTCMFTVTATDVTVDPTSPTPDAVGMISFTVTDGGEMMIGTVTFDGTDIAKVDSTFKGESFSFGIDLNDFSVVL